MPLSHRQWMLAQAQFISFRCYPDVLAHFKRGSYPLLLNAVTLPEDSEECNATRFLGTEKAALVVTCCQEFSSCVTHVGNVVQAQCILFRRYPEVLAPFKYGGYPLLLNAVTLPEDSEESNATRFLGTEKAALVVTCCKQLLSCFT